MAATTICLAAQLEAAGSSTMQQTYAIQSYALCGNTALDEAAVCAAVTNAVGPAVTLDRIGLALADLRKRYQARGYLQAQVFLPEQTPANGVVQINVLQGRAAAEVLPGLTETNPAAARKFEVHRFEVVGNTLLPAAEIEKTLQPATGPAVTLEDIRRAATQLRRMYHERGYVTVAVNLPPQRLTNATVQLVVTEGKLASVQVVGNRYFSSENILQAFPDLPANGLLNSHIFQRELDEANRNRDRQIYPTLGPGPEPGTSALTLRVQDRLPLHASLETDNYNTPGTPDWRVNFSAQYNNLWQREQQAGVAYSFTPQEMKTLNNTPDFGFNQPLISSYSAFYRIPVSSRKPLGEQMAGSSRFGYQEATHQFLLPPGQSDAELIFYASAAASDTGVKWGSPETISRSDLLAIVSRDSQQSTTDSANLGSQFRWPLFSGDHIRINTFIGVDFKQSGMEGYSTNNFFITTVTTNQFGAQTNRVTSSKAQPSTSASVAYFPINGGMDISENDAGGSAQATLTLAGNFTGNQNDFAGMAYSHQARALYGKAMFSAARDQKLPGGSSLLLRASGQAATGALIGNEQFALGGVNSVRGYYEGDQYGDCGWFGSVEWRTPFWETRVAQFGGFVPAWLRAGVFTDFGEAFLLESSAPPGVWLWSTGFGLSGNINNRVLIRLNVAWPLAATANTRRGDVRAGFSLGGQF